MFRSEQRRRREWPRCRPRAHRAVVLLSFLSFSLSFSLFSAHFSFYCSALSPSLIHFAFRSEKRMAEMEATSAQNSHAPLLSLLSHSHILPLFPLFSLSVSHLLYLLLLCLSSVHTLFRSARRRRCEWLRCRLLAHRTCFSMSETSWPDPRKPGSRSERMRRERATERKEMSA